MVTFCQDSATPVAAEEGLSGVLSPSSRDSVVKCYGSLSQFSEEEVQWNHHLNSLLVSESHDYFFLVADITGQ